MLPRCLAWSVLSIFVDFVKLPLCQFNKPHCCPRNALCLTRLFCFFPNAERRVLVFLVGGLGGALFAACCVSRGSNQPLAVPIGIATKRDVVEVAKLHFVWQVWDEVLRGARSLAVHTPHSTLHTSFLAHRTPQSTRHTSHSTRHTSYPLLPSSHFKLHTSHPTLLWHILETRRASWLETRATLHAWVPRSRTPATQNASSQLQNVTFCSNSCEVAKCGVESLKCGECEVSSVKCQVKCQVWSVKCGVESVKCDLCDDAMEKTFWPNLECGQSTYEMLMNVICGKLWNVLWYIDAALCLLVILDVCLFARPLNMHLGSWLLSVFFCSNDDASYIVCVACVR